MRPSTTYRSAGSPAGRTTPRNLAIAMPGTLAESAGGPAGCPWRSPVGEYAAAGDTPQPGHGSAPAVTGPQSPPVGVERVVGRVAHVDRLLTDRPRPRD